MDPELKKNAKTDIHNWIYFPFAQFSGPKLRDRIRFGSKVKNAKQTSIIRLVTNAHCLTCCK